MSRSKVARLERRVEILEHVVDLHNHTIDLILKANRNQQQTIAGLLRLVKLHSGDIRELKNVSKS
jgi:hypothetical protein